MNLVEISEICKKSKRFCLFFREIDAKIEASDSNLAVVLRRKAHCDTRARIIKLV